jgi:Spy/CpxP family protein refolding chaperone
LSFLIQSAASSLLSSLVSGQQPATAVSPNAKPAAGNSVTSGSSTSPFANLNLTAQEQAEISSILQTAQSQHLSFAQIQNKIANVLTPSQQATLQSDLQGVRSHHHHGHHHGGGGGGSSSTIDSGTDAFGVPSIGGTTSTAPTAASSLFSDIAAQLSVQSQT